MYAVQPTKAEMLSRVPQANLKRTLKAPSKRATLEVWREDGTFEVWYHETKVIEVRPDGKVVLDTGGYYTVTTKSRMNEYLPQGFGIYQSKGDWYVQFYDSETGDRNSIPYFDGIVLDPRNPPRPDPRGEKEQKRRKALRKSINEFSDKVLSLDSIPIPDPGDCWTCASDPEQTKPHTCLESHIEEGCLHGSLIRNAFLATGHSVVSWTYFVRTRNLERIRQVLRQYLRKELLGASQ